MDLKKVWLVMAEGGGLEAEAWPRASGSCAAGWHDQNLGVVGAVRCAGTAELLVAGIC